MTSPYLLARKPEEEKPPEEVGQTPRRRPTLSLPLQAAEPNRPVETPKWQLAADITKKQFTDAAARNVITPPATSLQSSYSTIFPIVKSIGDIAQSGQEAASETRRIREAQVEAARLAEENRKAMEEAYRRSANIPITQYNPNPNIGGVTYSGNVTWDQSDAAIADLMRKAGFPESEIATGIGIMHAENRYLNYGATHRNSDGSVDVGLFQINNKAHADKLANSGGQWTNPQINANIAYQVWKEAGGSWSPWVTYTDKTYQQWVPSTVPATRLTATSTSNVSNGVYTNPNGTLSYAPYNGGNYGPPNYSGMAGNTAAARDFVTRTFGINNIGGFGGGSVPGSDHPKGKAIDVMIPSYSSAYGINLGTTIANWFIQNPAAFGTKYIIWRDRIWQDGRWSAYGHPTMHNDTGQHRDHVHVSFY